MRIEDFDYELPEELIAQKPADRRDSSRLLVVHRDKLPDGGWGEGSIEHRHFYDILEYLKPGDCLVLNNSKVIPARLYGVKAVKDKNSKTPGARAEFLLIKRAGEEDLWEVMVRPGRRLKPGDDVIFSGPGSNLQDLPLLKAHILDYGQDGTRIVRFEYEGIFMERLEEIGSMPLPPYIQRPSEGSDKDRYQTVYCREEGSVAAPTAGLHFTKELLNEVKEKGVDIAEVTLHVGLGTFRPVKVDNVLDHHMHSEFYQVNEEAARIINETKERGGRVICVGTTSCRTIESAADENGLLSECCGNTEIFIYPGYKFKVLDCLITNFHLPESTLVMLVSALAGREHVLAAYREAIKEKYRFFSFGDACFFTDDFTKNPV